MSRSAGLFAFPGVRVPTVLTAATLGLTAASNAAAQPIARADVAGTVGWFNADKSEINGTWTQGGKPFALNFRRADATAPAPDKANTPPKQ